ncbi:MAG: arsenic efflux protein [Clostridia bacterium]|nr:arsenic efflux protein [Clostridia bacterium]
MFLLHVHTGALGIEPFFEEVILHSLLSTLELIPFLFLTYLVMEFIEHRASDKAERFMRRAGALGPLVGGALGIVPQCGFSAAAANLYTARVVTLGTLVAVFLSTSDEMIPILIAGNIPFEKLALILAYKTAVGVVVGFVIDIALRLIRGDREPINIDELCESDECHCERGILYSAVHHTVTISVFVLAVTVGINALVFFASEQTLAALFLDKPVISHLVSAVVGLIPNCASSVLVTTMYGEGIISVGTMLSGLFSGAGVGLLVLYRVNRRMRENLIITLILVAVGVVFGLLGDFVLPI